MSGDTVESWLASVAANASTITERMRGGITARTGAEARVEARIDRWCAKVAEGDRGLFEARLAASGWDLATVRPMLGDVAWQDGRPLPEWTEVVAEASTIAEQLADNSTRASIDGRLNPPEDLPFGRLAVPFVVVAERRLMSWIRASASGALLTGALETQQRHLLEQLASLASAVHGLRFSVFRRAALGALGEHVELAADVAGTDLHDEYETRVLADGYRRLFTEYPSLARRAACAVVGWVAGLRELVTRRITDADDLHATYGVAAEVPIADIRSTAGDTHDGRRVLRVILSDGTHLAYKPRPIATQLLWDELCRWLSDATAGPPMPTPAVVEGENWGWSTWIEWRPCAAPADVADVYRTAGMIVALGSVLGSTDLHYENVVVDGRGLVVVDNEMALQPDTSMLERALSVGVPALADRTVAQMGLLPTVTPLAANVDGDISALGRIDELRVPGRQWRHVGSNALHMETAEAPIESANSHLIVLDGEVQTPEAHRDEIVEGFRDAYRQLVRHSDQLAERISRHGDTPIRVVVRATPVYGRLLVRLADPDAMRGGVDQQIQAEILGRPLLHSRVGVDYWPIVDAEVEALVDGDVPIFSCSAQATDLPVKGAANALVLGEVSALEHALARCTQLGEDDRKTQEMLIGAHLALRTWTPDGVRLAPTRPSSNSTPPNDAQRALDAALCIGDRLAKDSFQALDGSLHWIGATLVGREHLRVDLRRTGPFLYDGNAGIGLLFAALAHATQDARWRKLAIASLKPILQPLGESGHQYVKALGLGAHGGAAGVAYALAVSGRLLGEEQLEQSAREIVNGLVVLDPAEDQAHDVIGGSAGTILGVLALMEPLGCPVAVEVASRCAASLIRAAVPRGEAVVWPGPEEPLVLGNAHGAGGIGAALAAAAAKADDERLASSCARLATGAMRALSVAYVDRERRWRDEPALGLRRRPPRSWCHGSTGQLHAIHTVEALIGVDARLAVQTDSVRAADSVPDGSRLDSLCCGRAGHLEYWRRSSAAKDRKAYAAHSAAFVSPVADEVIANGGRAVGLSIRPDVAIPAPGLFQGDAGVGYVLAAVADPTLPVLGDWQVPMAPDGPLS